MRPIFLVALFTASFSAAAQDETTLPEALRALLEQRRSMETGNVEYRVETRTLVTNPQLRKDMSKILVDGELRRVRNLTARFAGEDLILVNNGDDDGVVIGNPDGSVGPRGRSAVRTLRTAAQTWEVQDGDPHARAFDPGLLSLTDDPRVLGVTFHHYLAGPIERVVTAPAKLEPKYRERREGDLHVVTLETKEYTRT